MQILAGDIGGTNTRLALLEESGKVLQSRQTFSSKNYPDLKTIVEEFLGKIVPDIACFGIAGPVEGSICRATNLPWIVDSRALEKETKIQTVYLINDLVASAYGTQVLQEEDVLVLHSGAPQVGNQALISPGTGLGEAGMFWIKNHLHPFSSEGGHADFAPVGALQEELLLFLRRKFSGHISYERVLSGPGLKNIYLFLTEEKKQEAIPTSVERPDFPKYITKNALEGACPACIETLNLFLAIYGAEAGNLALKFLAVGGVYLGGGIVPHIAPLLKKDLFMRSFLEKGRFRSLLQNIPVKVVLNDQAALLGALEFAIIESGLR